MKFSPIVIIHELSYRCELLVVIWFNRVWNYNKIKVISAEQELFADSVKVLIVIFVAVVLPILDQTLEQQVSSFPLLYLPRDTLM